MFWEDATRYIVFINASYWKTLKLHKNQKNSIDLPIETTSAQLHCGPLASIGATIVARLSLILDSTAIWKEVYVSTVDMPKI